MSILSQQKQSVNTDFPNIRPSLDLRFAFAKKLDPRITFTRVTSGTYFGPDRLMRTAGVNEPRFDHDPVTGQSLGLLVEESRINYTIYSTYNTAVNSGGSAWFMFTSQQLGLSITTGLPAPDGSNTAARFVSAGTNYAYARIHFPNLPTTPTGIQYTFSFYAKLNKIPILTYGYNVDIGDEGGFNYYSQLKLGEWVRISRTVNKTNSSTHKNFADFINGGIVEWDLTVWGVQVEEGGLPTSYIPTSGSTVIRSADNVSMTGTNFSSWYNQSEGTIYLETNKLYAGNFDSFRHPYSINDATSFSSEITAYASPSTTTISNYGISNGGRQIFDYIQISIGSAPTTFKLGQSVNTKYSFFTSSKGTTTPQLPSRSSPNGQNLSLATNMTQLSIGSQFITTFSKHMNSHIARFTYYPIQITNQQLINLTL